MNFDLIADLVDVSPGLSVASLNHDSDLLLLSSLSDLLALRSSVAVVVICLLGYLSINNQVIFGTAAGVPSRQLLHTRHEVIQVDTVCGLVHAIHSVV